MATSTVYYSSNPKDLEKIRKLGLESGQYNPSAAGDGTYERDGGGNLTWNSGEYSNVYRKRIGKGADGNPLYEYTIVGAGGSGGGGGGSGRGGYGGGGGGSSRPAPLNLKIYRRSKFNQDIPKNRATVMADRRVNETTAANDVSRDQAQARYDAAMAELQARHQQDALANEQQRLRTEAQIADSAANRGMGAGSALSGVLGSLTDSYGKNMGYLDDAYDVTGANRAAEAQNVYDSMDIEDTLAQQNRAAYLSQFFNSLLDQSFNQYTGIEGSRQAEVDIPNQYKIALAKYGR